MGIIQRQGIKHSIVNFTGLTIGTASTLFIYSRKEVVESYGLVQFLLTICVVGFPLFALSANTVAIRYFPSFQNKEKRHHGFLGLLLCMCLAGWAVCAILALVFWKFATGNLAAHSAMLQQYLWMAIPLTLLYTMALLLTQYSFNFKRIVIPSILFDFSLKLLLPLIMGALWLGWISVDTTLWVLLVHFGLVITGLILYLRSLGEWFWRPDWSFLTPELRNEIIRYAGFGIATGFALLVATKADTLMVGGLVNMKSTGAYVIALNIAAAMEIPNKSMLGASVSFTARYLADENWKEMGILYQKVSITLLTAGLLIFGCIWVSAEDLYAIMPNTDEIGAGLYVLLFLSVAKLFDMAAGLNNQLVYYSRYYRYSMVALGILAMANVLFNFWLIPQFGIVGAAVAALLSMVCYNLFSLILVWKKFSMQPFTRNTLVVVVLAVLAILLVSQIPQSPYPILNIGIRAGLYSLMFSVLVIRLHVSEDINAMYQKYLAPLFSRSNRNV
ncbi:MAG: hypothetical protein EP344_09430 [Bacteroidetes bacterium]|nr:MAG: hypothetical protein EP344_09430 [Bacteroidota bacterium]